MIVFLGLNKLSLVAKETEVVSIILDTAAGNITETDLANWIQDHLSK